MLLYVKKALKPVEVETLSTFVDHVFCKVGNLLIGVCYRSSNYTIVGRDNNDSLNQLIKNISDKHFLIYTLFRKHSAAQSRQIKTE